MAISDAVADRTATAFPVEWERPEDQLAFWVQERMGNPEPLPPLEEAFVEAWFGEPFRRAAELYELGIRGRSRRVNTYLYATVEPIPAPLEEEAARAARSREKLTAAMARLEPLWQDELLPEVQEHLAYWARFDLAGATVPGLLLHLDETMPRFGRLFEIHFQIVFPVLAAMSEFDELYTELFGRDDAFGAYRLLQGLGNMTTEGTRALWRLSRSALRETAVREALVRYDPSDLRAALG